MAELETRLRALGDELAWPETPDLAGAVLTALAAGAAAAAAGRARAAPRRTAAPLPRARRGAPPGAAVPVTRRLPAAGAPPCWPRPSC